MLARMAGCPAERDKQLPYLSVDARHGRKSPHSTNARYPWKFLWNTASGSCSNASRAAWSDVASGRKCPEILSMRNILPARISTMPAARTKGSGPLSSVGCGIRAPARAPIKILRERSTAYMNVPLKYLPLRVSIDRPPFLSSQVIGRALQFTTYWPPGTKPAASSKARMLPTTGHTRPPSSSPPVAAGAPETIIGSPAISRHQSIPSTNRTRALATTGAANPPILLAINPRTLPPIIAAAIFSAVFTAPSPRELP